MTVPPSENRSPNVSFERERGVYGLHVTHDVAHAVVRTGDDEQRTHRILQVLASLAEANVPLFLIKMHRSAITMAMAGMDLDRARQTLEAAGMRVTTRRDLAVIAVRAASMRELHGVMVSIADALFTAGAHLLEIGDSHDSVQCLIEAQRVPAALAELRRTFHLDSSAVREHSLEAEDAL